MRKIFLAVILLTASVAFVAAKSGNYAGKWTLDIKQSKNLPPFYDNVKSHKLSVSQDEKTLNVAVEIDSGQPNPDKLNYVYNLDGSEIKAEAKIRTPNGPISVPATFKAIAGENGKLQVTIVREIPVNGETIKGITVEDWQLSTDGKTLMIHRVDESPRGKLEIDMVFVKE